jgi:DNA repair protein SbcC/Rad50
MSKYKISKIYIENFKLIDRALIDFNNEDLIVLDGPNGFGKTTIFDAIELVLTGKIARIENYNKQSGFNTLLFSKDDKKDTIIKIEFISEHHAVTFIKWYTYNNNLQKRDRKPDNWELFKTYQINDFNDSFTDAKIFNQKTIYEVLGINDDLERLYNLYYYIQQEENTYFLKQPGKKRMENINHLFDTKKEEEEQQEIANVRKTLMDEKKKVETEIKDTISKIENYKGMENGEESYEVVYAPLLSNGIQKEWDKKELKVESKEQRDKYIADLIDIEDFVVNYNEFKKAKYNKGLVQIVNNQKLLENTIIASHFLDEYEQIKKQFDRGTELARVQKELEKNSFLKNINEINFEKIKEEINLDIDYDDIENSKKSIIFHKNSASDLSNIVKQLNDTRKQLLDHYKEVIEETKDKQGECPFCGHDWTTFENLLSEVEAKRESFLSYYDNATQLIEEKVDELFENHINKILDWIKNELDDEQSKINKDFFLQLKNAVVDKKKIQDFKNWSNSNHIDISSFLNKERNTPVQEIKNKIQAFSDFILQQKKETAEGYSETDKKYKSFEYLYKDTFQESEEFVKKINKDQIEQKKKYINNAFYHNNTKKLELENKNLKKSEEINQKLDEKITELKNIYDLYDSEIKRHWNKIMKDIEIPFYIYSGKIIQEYQKGLGIFIEESPSGEASNIKFVSDNKYDHDAINYLSSGQLSALVISFTLALNKVYGNQSLDLILIDDPVQTMDEINMASLTELLRNEFANKQIIISTHEDDVSRFLRYKFKKYGLKAMRFNVKEDLYKYN